MGILSLVFIFYSGDHEPKVGCVIKMPMTPGEPKAANPKHSLAQPTTLKLIPIIKTTCSLEKSTPPVSQLTDLLSGPVPFGAQASVVKQPLFKNPATPEKQALPTLLRPLVPRCDAAAAHLLAARESLEKTTAFKERKEQNKKMRESMLKIEGPDFPFSEEELKQPAASETAHSRHRR